MPSFRSVFILATATLASFTSALPLSTSSLPAVGSVGGGLPALPAVPGLGLRNIPDVPSGVPKDVLSHFGGGKRGDPTPQSLPCVLEALEAKLHDICDDLTALVGIKTDVDVSIIAPVLQELNTVFVDVDASVKALIGLSADVILTFDGKIFAVADIANLLCAILTLVCTILALAVKAVGAAGAQAIAPLVTAVACAVAAVLAIVLQLVAGLLAVLVPLLGDVISVCVGLKLDVILSVLQVSQ